MPVSKEFIVLMDDTRSTLGKVCRALADRNVNILGLHSFPIGGKAVTRFVVDSPTAAKAAFDGERVICAEGEVVQVKLPHRPGEIARVATRFGESKMNINYAYGGLSPERIRRSSSSASRMLARRPRFSSKPQPRPRSLRLRGTLQPFSRERLTPAPNSCKRLSRVDGHLFCKRTSLGKKEK